MDSDNNLSPPSSPFHGFQSGNRTAAGSPLEEEEPCHGFANADIPQPIIIKTQPAEGQEDEDDVIIVEVRKASKPVEFLIKKEILDDDDDDEDAFHGFSITDIPRPIIIKEEPQELSVHRAEVATEHLFIDPPVPLAAVDVTGTDQLVKQPSASHVPYSPGKSPFRPISPDRSGPPLDKSVSRAAAFVATPHEAAADAPQPTATGNLLALAAETLFQKPAGPATCDESATVVASEDGVINTEHDKSVSDMCNSMQSEGGQEQPPVAVIELTSSSVSESEASLTETVVVTGSGLNTGDIAHSQMMELPTVTAETAIQEQDSTEPVPLAHGFQTESEEQMVVDTEQVYITTETTTSEEVGRGGGVTVEQVHTEQAQEDQPIMIIVDDRAHSVGLEAEADSSGNIVIEQHEHVVQMSQKLDDENTIQIINVNGLDAESTGSSTFVSIKPKLENVPASPGKIVQARLSQRMVNKYSGTQVTIFETTDLTDGRLDLKNEIAEIETNTSNRLPRNIQILDENGENIVLMTNGDDSEEDSDDEDREFTVIVEDDLGSDEEMELEAQDGQKTRIEAESIEDILAQFEAEPATKTVSCPNCRKCFVSQHFLNLHISNASTMCELCNTQCCTAVNLRNHRNLECDLAKRKRNIDLIAQETALLGRKPIEPEKYYNLPIESSDEETEPVVRKPVKSVNDQKYECSICGQYVKILDSHMKFIHGLDGARGSKYKCQECGVLVSDITKHRNLRHDPTRKIVIADLEPDVVRCKNPGCDMFFNNPDEAAEHNKREHSDEVRLACGMGNCSAVFDNRGSLRKHRSDAHPELDEFRPVDLEVDDPDRDLDLTVACPVCEKKFKHKNTCTVHIKVHHLGWAKRKLFECPDCYKSFENKKAMDMHRESIHLGIRTVCPLCDKPVTRLDLHVRMVHTELPEWPCPDCGKKFKRKFDLNRHRVTVHLGVRNFPCDLCGKRFADMKDMTRHKNAVHYGMKIKWNSRRHKEERLRRREIGERSIKYKSQRREERRGRRGVPVEFMETVETSSGGGHQIDLEEGAGGAVILDPMLQSQLEAVQGTAGDARVLIEADPDSSGGLRFVVIQDESGLVEDEDDEVEEEEEEENGLEDEQEDDDEEYDENELVVEC